MEPIEITIPLIRAAFLREILKISIAKLISFSNTPIIVERAANVRKRKKRLPQILPPGMEEKTLGIVRNIRFGPESGAIP